MPRELVALCGLALSGNSIPAGRIIEAPGRDAAIAMFMLMGC